MPLRSTNGRPSRRRWYHRICLMSSADDGSDSSESETQDFPPPPNIPDDHLFPPPEMPSPASEDDWPLHPPPPPPPPFMRNHDLVQRPIHENITEILRDEDDHHHGQAKMDGVRNMVITEAITREKAICPICKDEFKLGGNAGKLPCDHFFCFECIHGWLNLNENNNTCPVCRLRLPSGEDFRRPPQFGGPPPPQLLDGPWQNFFSPPVTILSVRSELLDDDETQSSPSPSVNNSEAGYDTARDELDASHACS